MTDNPEQMKKQQAREAAMVRQALQTKQPISYIDYDGCEVTITAGGHVFYNASDWY